MDSAQGRTLRRTVSVIALAVAITTAVAVPAGYFLVGYTNTAEVLAFKARLNAARVAQYIYTHNVMWQYQQLRLSELMQLPEGGEQPTRQRVFDKAKRLVLEEGPELSAPVMRRSTLIVVGDAAVGSLVAEASLRGTLFRTGFVALLSVLLGYAIYFTVRELPMRVLDRTLRALRDAQRNLVEQNERFETALTNMSQGLCMFDAEGRLVIFNTRFAEIYGILPDAILPGMTTPELMELASHASKITDVDAEGTMALQRNFIHERKAGSLIERLSDGRSVAISHRPMPDGGFVATFEDITNRLRAEAKIKHLAHYDALTDLPNRGTFYERMASVLGHLRRSETIAVLSLDLDRFKNVNDMLGHPIGDRVLQTVAERMRSCVRSEDIVARLGGDEFAVMQIPSREGPDAGALAARLIEVVGAPYDLDGHQVSVGVSVGVAMAPADGKHPDGLMKNADLALYRAKADGGGVYRYFEAEMDARMQARRLLELDLRKAIVNNEFELYYQPIINVRTGQITSCEALVRWHHPERGMIAPLDFIPLAEETGTIVPLGEWVLRQACNEAMRWPKHVTVAVNLSPAQFKSRNLVQSVADALADSGLAAERLELEITELVLLQESEGAFAILHQFRDLGIKIAMDDFGTGYSSLGYLRSFPFDKIKIDQSFIRDLPAKQDSVAIVRAVVGLSSSLGITTTAEGVETKEQLASLTAEGCIEVQGFLFSQPRPAAEVAHILREMRPEGEAVA
jgi:diguanylate cyclase (GGDEF)-like protein/PAS domain S-box-containing protein